MNTVNKKVAILLILACIIGFVSYKYGASKTNDPVTDFDFRLPGYAIAILLVYLAIKNAL